jgi:nucleoside-diphosphate-sugar epimerase
MTNSRKTVIIAGGRGFIGAHISSVLLQQDFQVISIDSGLFEPASIFLEHRASPLLVDLAIDASDYDAVVSGIELDHPPEAIINCVGPARPTYYLENPILTATTLTNATSSLLKLAAHWGTRYIHASSSETYGNIASESAGEDNSGSVNTLSLRSAYAEAKRFCETLVVSYVHEKRISAILLRLFNAYGPRFSTDDDRVVPAFIHALQSEKPLEVHGSGKQIRSFCFIDDIVRAFVASISCPCSSFHCLNIGNPEPISILDLAKLTGQMLHRHIDISYVQGREDDVEQRVPDISRAREILGWEPQIMLQEGLRKTLGHYFQLEE